MPCARDDIFVHKRKVSSVHEITPPPNKKKPSPITPACPNTTVPVDQCILG